MDIMQIIRSADPNIVIFILTTFIAFISWLVKSLVEKPIMESKNTFNKYFEKRIEVLAEFKTRLNFIAYFPTGEDNVEYKNQLQTLLLKDGKSAYLSKDTFDNILRISIDKNTDEKLLLNTIDEINKELYLTIAKVKDEVDFYRKFSNYNPLKRFVGFTILSLQYIISLSVVIFIFLFFTFIFLDGDMLIRFAAIILGILGLIITSKWLRR